MPWKAPFKDKSRVGIGTAVAATEGSSGASTGGQSIAGGKKVAKSDGKIGGKVKKVPKVAKKKENSSKKVARPKPKIDGLSFSGSPVKMKKVSLRGKTQKTTTPGRSFISDCEEEEEEEEEEVGVGRIQRKNCTGEDSFAKALFNMVGDDMDDLVSSGSVVVQKENLWLGESQVKLKIKKLN